MMRLLMVLVAAGVLLAASPATAAHRYRGFNGAYGGWTGWGGHHHGYRPYTSFYNGGFYPPAYRYPLYPFYPARAFGHGYGTGLPYPYYNNYLFGSGGTF